MHEPFDVVARVGHRLAGRDAARSLRLQDEQVARARRGREAAGEGDDGRRARH